MATRDALREGAPQVPLTAGPLKAPPSRPRNKGAAPGARCARPGATSGERSRRPLTSRVSGEGCARPARLALHAAVSPALFFCYSELTSPTLRGRPMGGGGHPLISMPWNRPLRQRPGGGAWPAVTGRGVCANEEARKSPPPSLRPWERSARPRILRGTRARTR